jgi:hypothetical protein
MARKTKSFAIEKDENGPLLVDLPWFTELKTADFPVRKVYQFTRAYLFKRENHVKRANYDLDEALLDDHGLFWGWHDELSKRNLYSLAQTRRTNRMI